MRKTPFRKTRYREFESDGNGFKLGRIIQEIFVFLKNINRKKPLPHAEYWQHLFIFILEKNEINYKKVAVRFD